MNYCRQVVASYRDVLANPGRAKSHGLAQHIIDLANASQKFLLPVNGRFFEDASLRGLDPDTELRLPYAFVSLEWRSEGKVRPGDMSCSRRVVFAREDGDMIRITIAFYADADGTWMVLPDIGIRKVGWHLGVVDGRAKFDLQRTSLDVPLEDVNDEATAVLSFLNALACTNVKVERLDAKQRTKKVKSALPFDEYHVLTIDTKARGDGEALKESHRSPREHLRRGHIRRYESGLKVWINATVINAGSGGKITKDYRVR